MKRLHAASQNFLRSPKVVEGLIARSQLGNADLVYDIGAGSGVMTAALAPRVRKVVAVENDPRLIETLERNTAPLANVEIVAGDYLALPLPSEPYSICANIPFHLSSPIIKRLIGSPNGPQAAYLIVQKQFGRKLVPNMTTEVTPTNTPPATPSMARLAPAPHTDTAPAAHFTSQLGMCLGAEYSVRIVANLRKTDFWPHPAVDTVWLELIKRSQPLVPPERLPAYIRFTEACFASRAQLATMPLASIGATAGLSPSRLALEQWVLLFNSQKRF